MYPSPSRLNFSSVSNFLFFPVLLRDVGTVSPAKPGGFKLCRPMRIVPSAQLHPAPWGQLYPAWHSITSANWVTELQAQEAWTDPSFALATGGLTGFHVGPEEGDARSC